MQSPTPSPFSPTARAVTLLLAVGFSLALAATEARSSWPRFGGPEGNFQAPDAQIAPWTGTGPKKLWEQPLGLGYSGVVTDGETVYTLYRDRDDDAVVAFGAGDGSRRWQHRYTAPARRGHQPQFGTGPHATPLLLDDRLITLSYSGELRALATKDGKLLWRRHLLDELGGDVLPWGYSAGPILHGGSVVVLVGGKAGAVAFDPKTGEVRWQSPPTSVSYATPVVVKVDGRDQLLYYGDDALHAIDPNAEGASLWKISITNSYDNHASMPVALGDGRLWVTSQQQGGGRVLRLSWPESGPKAEQLWQDNRLRVHHWNSLVLPLEGGETAFATFGDQVQILAGADIETGEVLWRDRSFGMSNFVHTPNGTLLLNADGELAFVKLSREGVKTLARAKIADGVTWSAPTVAGSRVYVRDKKKIQAFDLAPPPPAESTSGR